MSSKIVDTPSYASRLILGTVQFGLDYGIANRTGRPKFDAICEILRVCSSEGMTMLDAAASYGDVEEILGRALEETGLRQKLLVTTKLEPLPSGLSKREAGHRIEEGVRRAVRRLGVDRLAVCLFHKEENIEYADELLKLQQNGMIDAVGVSLVTPGRALEALRIPDLTVWQIPSSVIDRRYTGAGITERAHAAGIRIFVRSIYLQGLLLMDDAVTPVHLCPFLGPRRKLREIAANFGMSLAELALRAMLSRPDIDSLVVGSETLEQVRENLALFKKGPLPAEAMAALDAFVPGVDERLLNPGEWVKLEKGE